MRKNVLNKNLQYVQGGVCAPKGFTANGTRIRLSAESEDAYSHENAALLLSNRYCTVACEFLSGKTQGICALVDQKHLKMQYARGVFLNGEVAFSRKVDVQTMERVCFEVGKGLQVPDEEILLLTCGTAGKRLPLQPLVDGVKRMLKTASDTPECAESAARAISKTGVAQTCAYEFDLGNYTYKIGALFAGETATTCLLTTDVSISSEMLRKALSTAVKDTLALIQHEGEQSPNSIVCILASGEVGNYCIVQEDSEYEKFLDALECVLHKVGQALASACGNRRVLTCIVENTKSKRVSRALAKGLAHGLAVKEILRQGEFPLDGILCALCSANESFALEKISVTIRSQTGEFLVYENGRALMYEKPVAKNIIDGENLMVIVDCKSGNYHSIAYGGF